MNWRHSGFSVHAGNPIARADRDGQQALAEYILRNAFSEQKITCLEDTGKVLYRSAMTHGSNKKNFEIFTAEVFIAATLKHLPDKNFQMVRYYRWYSSRSRSARPPGSGARADTLPSPSHKEAILTNDLPHSCPNLPQPCQKIEKKSCLTQLTTPATQKPSKSNFLSPHLLPTSTVVIGLFP